MAIVFNCECGKKLSAQEQHVGFTVRCPACGHEMSVPDSSGGVGVARRRRERADPDDREDRPRRAFLERSTSGLAVASLIFGILGFCAPLVGGIVGLILGIAALASIRGSQGRQGGTMLAVGGIAASVISLLLIIPIAWYAFAQIKEAEYRIRDANNLQQLGLAIHMYHDAHGDFPGPGIKGPDGKLLLSWRVAILPYIDQDALYRQFRLDEPWDSPHNIQLLGRMPSSFERPDRTTERPGWTYYQAFVGPNAIFDPQTPTRLASVPDGTSNTVMLAEAAEAVPWTKPDDLTYDPANTMPRLGDPTRERFHVVFGDGSVKAFRKNPDPRVLRLLIDRQDGQMVFPDVLER